MRLRLQWQHGVRVHGTGMWRAQLPFGSVVVSRFGATFFVFTREDNREQLVCSDLRACRTSPRDVATMIERFLHALGFVAPLREVLS